MARRTNDDFNNLNKDDREAGTGLIVSYQSEEGGITLAVPGDDDAPYVIANGRASADGVAGLVEEPNGEMQRLALTEYGHVWVKVSELPPPTPTPITKVITEFNIDGITTPSGFAVTVQRITIVITAGAGFVQLYDTLGPVGLSPVIYTPIPIPTTLPAYIDIEFDTINGLDVATGLLIAVSTTVPTYTAPPLGSVVGTITTSYST
jgi:hypothetical protein